MNMPLDLLAVSNAQLRNQPVALEWIWEGYLARGAITLLSASEKVGKTTLLSLLLDRRRSGGNLLDRGVRPGRTILGSEESPRLWSIRQPPLDFGPDLIFRKPEVYLPSSESWGQYCGELIELQASPQAFDLLVIDTAIHLMPLAGRNREVLQWALATLRRLALAETAVLVINQSCMIHRPLAAFADIVLEMSIPRGTHGPTRRRILTGVGRYPGTPARVEAELNEEGTDYQVIAGERRVQPPLLSIVASMLAASSSPLSHRDIMDNWPGEAPREDSVRRILVEGCERGTFRCAGMGSRNNPFQYELSAAVSPSQS